MCVVDPPLPSRLMFWAFIVSTAGTFTGTALLIRIFAIPLELAFSTYSQWKVVGVELVLAVLWLVLLRRHGWTLACVTKPLSGFDLLHAVVLIALCHLAYGLATTVWALTFPVASQAAHALAHGRMSLSVICAVSLVNPMFEEFVYLGFVANVLRRRGELSAIVSSVAARMAVHVYQGPLRVVGMAALGVALSVYYCRTRRIWPVVIAHGLLDFMALSRV